MDSHKPQSILLVDDTATNLYTLAAILADQPANIIKTSSPEEALRYVERDPSIAVMLLDVVMPGINGYELAERIHKLPNSRYIPIIFVTADLLAEPFVQRGYTTGAIDYLTKPVDAYLLNSKVSALLELHALRCRTLEQGKQAEELNHKLQLVLDSAAEGIMELDHTQQIRFANPAALKLLDISWQEAEAQNISAFFPHMSALLDGSSDTENMETHVHRKNGQRLPILISVRPTLDQQGKVWVFRDISGRKAMESYLEKLAKTDPLTGLANRSQIQDALENSLRRAERFHHTIGMLYIDLDGFKHINDALSQDVGDEVLKEVARRLQKIVRHYDTVGRLGSDEFTVIIEDIHNSWDLARIAEDVLKVLKEPVVASQHEIFVCASIGIAMYPNHAAGNEQLVRAAETGMHAAKNKGGSCYQFFTEQLDQQTKERLEIDRQLRHAIERNELSIAYQPQVDLLSGRIIGAEALLRWDNKVIGAISPRKFIPIAEETGMIIELSNWLLRHACADLHQWQKAGLHIARISINLSCRQLRENVADEFVELLTELIDHYQLSPKTIGVEITESEIMQDSVAAVRMLKRLQAMGVHIALDDFGTGYSSLTYIQRMPLDAIKLDRAFLQDIPDNSVSTALVQTIVNLGKSLGMEVVAEGVETDAQLEYLKRIGCDVMQGFHFSRPISNKAFSKLVRDNQHETSILT